MRRDVSAFTVHRIDRSLFDPPGVGPEMKGVREIFLIPGFRDARRRLDVRPGLTGLWQVSGRSDLAWDDAIRLDLYYVDNWSLLADLLIVLETIPVVLGRRGAR